jgi:4-hydroxybenzoate polyprenyltransferase
MRVLSGLVRAMRPQHWVKNLFVFAPFLFAGEWGLSGVALRTTAAFAIFCLLASGVYLLNDAHDREADRLHPEKRLRPVAAGDVPPALAVAFGAVLIVAGLAWARFGLQANRLAMASFATYVVVQVAYTWWLKRVVILDVLCISSGFVLRLLAGASATFVEQSAWILVCTIFLSLFLALCKRRHEVVSLGQDAAAHRAILADYPPALLDQLISAATACILVTYALYTVDARTAQAHRLFLKNGHPSPVLAATVPFVVYGVFRYLFLVYRRDEGGSPTSTLLKDVPLLVNGLLYVATVVAVFKLAAR